MFLKSITLTNLLKIGSRIIFKDIGAYSLVKAHTFNGLTLPRIYFGNNSIANQVDINNLML